MDALERNATVTSALPAETALFIAASTSPPRPILITCDVIFVPSLIHDHHPSILLAALVPTETSLLLRKETAPRVEVLAHDQIAVHALQQIAQQFQPEPPPIQIQNIGDDELSDRPRHEREDIQGDDNLKNDAQNVQKRVILEETRRGSACEELGRGVSLYVV